MILKRFWALARVKVFKALLQNSIKSWTMKRRSQILVPPSRTRNCADKFRKSGEKIRLSWMWRWLRRWSDKNSRSTSVPLHIAQKRYLSRTRCPPLWTTLSSRSNNRMVSVQAPCDAIQFWPLMLCKNSVSSLNLRGKVSRGCRAPHLKTMTILRKIFWSSWMTRSPVARARKRLQRFLRNRQPSRSRVRAA